MQNIQPDSPLAEDSDAQPLHTAAPEGLEYIIARIQRELRVLRMEHKAILKRIEIIKKTAIGLADVFGPEVINGKLRGLLSVGPTQHGRRPGLTEVCRKLLQESAEPVTVRQMLDRIQQQQPDVVAHHKHPAVALRVVLRRLVSYGEAEELVSANSLRAWQRTGTAQPNAEAKQ